MAMSRQDAIREATNRLAQQQPGRPLAMTRDIATALLSAARENAKPASTEAENVLRSWGHAMAAATGMAPSLAAIVAEMKAQAECKRLAMELAGAKEESE